MSATKCDRNRVVTLRKRNPCLTLGGIGEAVGVTKERVRQILKKEGLPTKALHPKPMIECEVCGYPTPAFTQNGRPGRFCSSPCRKRGLTIRVACSECGKLFDKPTSLLIAHTKRGYEHFFCNNRCSGSWAGKHYGWPVHRKGHPLKYDYDMIWERHLETGHGCLRLSRFFGYPEESVSFILARMRNRRDNALSNTQDCEPCLTPSG